MTSRDDDRADRADRSETGRHESGDAAKPIITPYQPGNLGEAELKRETFAGKVAILTLGVRVPRKSQALYRIEAPPGGMVVNKISCGAALC